MLGGGGVPPSRQLAPLEVFRGVLCVATYSNLHYSASTSSSSQYRLGDERGVASAGQYSHGVLALHDGSPQGFHSRAYRWLDVYVYGFHFQLEVIVSFGIATVEVLGVVHFSVSILIKER